MSIWSFVSGVIKVETFSRSDPEAMFIAQAVVDHLPRIDGSEGCAKFYLNRIYGCNTSSNADEFLHRSNLRRGENDLGLFEWQTRILITVNGALRDADFGHALKDTIKMLARLSSRLWVANCLISVSSEDNQLVIHNPSWVLNREMSDWTDRLRRMIIWDKFNKE